MITALKVRRVSVSILKHHSARLPSLPFLCSFFFFQDMSAMPPSGEHTQYFKLGGKYKTDASHREAWCTYCLKNATMKLSDEDTIAYGDGTITRVRGRSELLDQGEYLCLRRPLLSYIKLNTTSRIIPTACLDLPALCSKAPRLKSHLKNCLYVPETIKNWYQDGNDLAEPPVKRQKTQQATFQITTKAKWTESEQETFEEDLCRLLIATNTPWNSVSNPEFKRFIQKHVGNAKIPTRQKLAGPVLTKAVQAIEADIRTMIEGGLGTGQCDGWKNIAKTSLVASVITVGTQVCISIR